MVTVKQKKGASAPFFCFCPLGFLLAFWLMWQSKFKKIVIVASVFFLHPMLNPSSFALARKKSPPKAYSFIAEGGKASQGECDGERKISGRLKRLNEFSKAPSYMGSELQAPEIKGKANTEMWKHLFRVKASCNSVLAQTPSSIDANFFKGGIPAEIPSEEEVEAEESPEASSETASTTEVSPRVESGSDL